MKKEDGYFKRLAKHPGLVIACIITLAFMFAGATNKSVDIWWHGALFGLVGSIIFPWSTVFISNIKRK